MKASIKFRDDERPLLRAKVPIALLGLPFQSGLAAGGDPRELRFDLSTAFASGPALRLSYRPNDPGLPFALSLRAGPGPLGSPARAPFALAAEFSLLSSDPSSPAFFLRLKPRLGDFSLSHTLHSASASTPTPRKVGEVSDGDGHGHVHEHETNHKAFSFRGSGLAAAGRSSGVGALLAGMRLTARSVLPLWGRASLRFSWGLRVPPELRHAAPGDGRKAARAPVGRMPLLVVSKVSIEQSPRAAADEDGGGADAAGDSGGGEAAFSLLRRQLESLSVDSVMLRRAVEDLRADVRSGMAASVAAAGAETKRVATPPPALHYHAFAAKQDRRGSGKEPAAEATVKAAAPEELGEELKKALEARRR
ncbi:hypothetical protein ACP4OV_017999 [Aristida adscensionis]